ncbi:DUF6896 domain-containing protein [Sphingobacterium sp.]|uniref:DUF6896 domain-containing protein n=1 Tax=Sphingobacterium sp. TaxID=341027 RepID=UPI003916F57A
MAKFCYLKRILHFINDFKYQFSPKMDEFEQKRSRNRSGEIGGFNYQFHGAGCRLEKDGIVLTVYTTISNLLFLRFFHYVNNSRSSTRPIIVIR